MKERKTDREILLEIFKRAGVNIIYEQDDYIEVEPETYGEGVGFDFDSQGNFKKLLYCYKITIMAKKINSEFKISNDSSFSITMGTSNKKNPEVIYAVISTYVTPLTTEINESLFLVLEKGIKTQLKKHIASSNLCNKDIIVVTGIATNRMIYNKQTYLDIQIYFKPTKETLETRKKSFKNISNEIYETYIKDLVKNAEYILSTNDFSLSQTKNKTVHESIY